MHTMFPPMSVYAGVFTSADYTSSQDCWGAVTDCVIDFPISCVALQRTGE